MIYVENDFYSNFNGAVRADDDMALQGMLVDQLSNLIAKRRGEVIQLFQKLNIKLSPNPSNEEIVDRLVRNLPSSKKLQVGLAYLIAKDNELLGGNERMSNVKGSKTLEQQASDKCERAYEKALKKYKTPSNPFPKEASEAFEECKRKYIERKTKKVDWDKAKGTVTGIADTLGVLAQTFGGTNTFKNNLQNQTNNKAPNYSGQGYQNNNNRPPKKKLTWLWVTLGVVAVGGLGYLAYKKGMFEKKG